MRLKTRLMAGTVLLLFFQQSLLAQFAPGYAPQFEYDPDVTQPGGFLPSRGASYGRMIEAQPEIRMHSAELPSYAQQNPASPFWAHRTGLSADFLYLTAREVDLAYATHVDGPIANAAPLAPSRLVDPDHEPGFRLGGAVALDSWTSITATFWYFRSQVSNSLMLPVNTGWIRSDTTHPTTAAIANDSLFASASDEIEFAMGDLAYRGLICGACDFSWNLLLGVRYAQLDQRFRGQYLIGGATTVDTEIEFNGLGPRFGLEGERRLDGGLLVYGHVFGNLLLGALSTDYIQQNATAGVQARADIDDDFRIVPQGELELGVGWQNSTDRLHVRAGYYLGTWFNVVTTPVWIDSVRTNNGSNLHESLIFDGMRMQMEYRF